MSPRIVQTGVVCSIGIGAQQCSASFRAGLSGYAQSHVIGRGPEPIVMALVPEEHVEPLRGSFDGRDLSDRERRMLRLGGMALEQLKLGPEDHSSRPVPLFLALPEPNPGQPAYSTRGFIGHLGEQGNVGFDPDLSQYFELGRAGGLFALRAGIAALEAGCEDVLVGGIDSCLDMKWVARIDADRRLLRADVMDGFVPGEAAAFLHLAKSRQRTADVCSQVLAVGTAEDSGHRYSDAPALGIGLASALESALVSVGSVAPFNSCYAGLNGENFGSKEWGVAHIRHHSRFAAEMAFEHPADCFGDVGAAMGPLLLSLADETLRNGDCHGPTLVWASSDLAPVACALIDVRSG
jgi:3-oxoacyl-[acyl-carrier-protein] synthase I